jgi:Animal haem peroxidase
VIDSGELDEFCDSFSVLKVSLDSRYENEDPAVRFTEAQLTELRKTTLAKIICDSLDVPGDMQRAAFDLPSNFL